MPEIMEVFDDIKKGVGDKGFYLLIGAGVLFGLYNLSKGSSSSESMANVVPVTGMYSYPDAVTNADVIISTLQDSIEYSEIQVKDHIDEKFEATNDYINKGLESSNKLMEENFEVILGGLDDLNATANILNKDLTTVKKDVSGIKSDVSGIKTNVSGIMSSVGSIKNEVSGIKTNVSGLTSKVDKLTTANKTTTKKATAETKTEYYKYKTKSGYNTSTSIVDAIKVATGNYNAPDLEAIAKANGIKNYSGTYSQNVQMLSMLKQGKLKKA